MARLLLCQAVADTPPFLLPAEERQAKAAADGVPVKAVRGAEGLTVRVVNNVNKVQEVKSQFHDAFKGDGFPASLPYRQKVGPLLH